MNKNLVIIAVSLSVLFLIVFTGCEKESKEGDNPDTDTTIVEKADNSLLINGLVSAQYDDSPSGEDISNVIDNNAQTKFLTFNKTVWIQWQGSNASRLSKYSITSGKDEAGRDPKSWNLSGSNNGEVWTSISTKTNQIFSARLQKKVYSVNTSKTYVYYRLEITENNGSDCTQLSEWGLTGTTSNNVVTLYSDCSYDGTSVSLSPGSYTLSVLRAKGMSDDDISSLSILPGYKVTMYDSDNFSGTSNVKLGFDDCLVDDGFNDILSSLKIETCGNTIDEILKAAYGYTVSLSTPMGNHYEGLHMTTESDRVFLNTASNQPPVPADLSSLHLAEFDVNLYPFGTPVPADINQHGIGDCNGISAMACMAYMAPSFVRSLISENVDKTFSVAMFDPQGLPVTVTVDSKFLAGSDGKISAVSSKNDVACWSTILEKAIMKHNMIYEANSTIEGINSEHVIPLFTGNGNSVAFRQGSLTNDQLELLVRYSLSNGKFITGGFNPPSTIGDLKTVSYHGYAVMISSDTSALFAMRNPWGFNPSTIDQGWDSDNDGLLNIPSTGYVYSTIDLRIIEPGIAGSAGTASPYIPPSAALKLSETIRITERLFDWVKK